MIGGRRSCPPVAGSLISLSSLPQRVYSLQAGRTMSTMTRISLAALAVSAMAAPLSAQGGGGSGSPPRPNPLAEANAAGVADTSIFAPLNLPTGNVYRSGSGMPGPKYWQQRADYDLHGTLDTAAKALHGEM